MLRDNHTQVTLPYGTLPEDIVDLPNVFGPLFIASCLNWALFGVLFVQFLLYRNYFPQRTFSLEGITVYFAFTLDSVSMVLITYAGWRIFVLYWGNVNILHELDWTWASIPIGTGLVSCVVQMFFISRIWKLSHKQQYYRAMCVFITLVCWTQCAFAIRTGLIAYQTGTFNYIRSLAPGVWLGGSALADLLICATLIALLRQSRGGFDSTNALIVKGIKRQLEASAVPACAALCKLGLVYGYHDNKHSLLCLCLGRLYSIMLLISLLRRTPRRPQGLHSEQRIHVASENLTRSSTRPTLLRNLKTKFRDYDPLLTLSSIRSKRAQGSVDKGQMADIELDLEAARDQDQSIDLQDVALHSNNARIVVPSPNEVTAWVRPHSQQSSVFVAYESPVTSDSFINGRLPNPQYPEPVLFELPPEYTVRGRSARPSGPYPGFWVRELSSDSDHTP